MKTYKLYEIWYVSSRISMPMSKFLTVFPFYREEVISIDKTKLATTLARLKGGWGDSDTTFEIREKKCEDDFLPA